eukprot:403342987
MDAQNDNLVEQFMSFSHILEQSQKDQQTEINKQEDFKRMEQELQQKQTELKTFQNDEQLVKSKVASIRQKSGALLVNKSAQLFNYLKKEIQQVKTQVIQERQEGLSLMQNLGSYYLQKVTEQRDHCFQVQIENNKLKQDINSIKAKVANIRHQKGMQQELAQLKQQQIQQMKADFFNSVNALYQRTQGIQTQMNQMRDQKVQLEKQYESLIKEINIKHQEISKQKAFNEQIKRDLKDLGEKQQKWVVKLPDIQSKMESQQKFIEKLQKDEADLVKKISDLKIEEKLYKSQIGNQLNIQDEAQFKLGQVYKAQLTELDLQKLGKQETLQQLAQNQMVMVQEFETALLEQEKTLLTFKLEEEQSRQAQFMLNETFQQEEQKYIENQRIINQLEAKLQIDPGFMAGRINQYALLVFGILLLYFLLGFYKFEK